MVKLKVGADGDEISAALAELVQGGMGPRGVSLGHRRRFCGWRGRE
jgi:hypothetical protein